MSTSAGDGAVRPRRGLPRPGEAPSQAVEPAAQSQAAADPAPAAPAAAGAPPARARRTGLPRPNDSAAPAAAAAPAPVADPAPAPAPGAAAPGRRTGLPRPGVAPAAPAPTAPAPAAPAARGAAGAAAPAAPPATGRRSGLPRPAAAPEAAATPAAAPAAAAAAPASSPAGPAGPTSSTGPGRRAGSLTPPAGQGAPRAGAPAADPARTPLASRRGARIAAGVVGLVVLAALVVLVARWVSTTAPVARFLASHDGTAALPSGAPVGIPVWLEWQHALNAFFIVLIIRTGWQVRTQRRPPATWVRNNEGLIKTKNPPKKISLTLWTHLTLDALWLLNGLVFAVLLFATGQWVRVVPTTWEVVPNAAAAALRYAAFDWPTEDGWVNYNALQTLAYFSVIFLAAPLAAVTGARMSSAWPKDAKRLNRLYPIEWARAVHFPVMLFFVLFVIVHVVLVLATGALRNLNHMYGASDTTGWVGAGIFAGTVVLMAGAVWAARPLVVAPIASLMGRVGS